MKKWMAKSLVIVTSKLWIDEGLNDFLSCLRRLGAKGQPSRRPSMPGINVDARRINVDAGRINVNAVDAGHQR